MTIVYEEMLAFERRRLRHAHTHEELDEFERHLDALVEDDLVTADEANELRRYLNLRRIIMSPGSKWGRFSRLLFPAVFRPVARR